MQSQCTPKCWMFKGRIIALAFLSCIFPKALFACIIFDPKKLFSICSLGCRYWIVSPTASIRSRFVRRPKFPRCLTVWPPTVFIPSASCLYLGEACPLLRPFSAFFSSQRQFISIFFWRHICDPSQLTSTPDMKFGPGRRSPVVVICICSQSPQFCFSSVLVSKLLADAFVWVSFFLYTGEFICQKRKNSIRLLYMLDRHETQYHLWQNRIIAALKTNSFDFFISRWFLSSNHYFPLSYRYFFPRPIHTTFLFNIQFVLTRPGMKQS